MRLLRPDEDEEFEPEKTGEELEPDLTPEEQAELEEELRAAERGYFRVSRSLSASLLFSLPLVVIYELRVLLARSDINAAAIWVKTPISWLKRQPFEILGADMPLVLNAVVIVAVLIAVWRLGRLGALHAGTFLGMFLESCTYALVLGPLALLPLYGRFTFPGFSPQAGSSWVKIATSCGAGFYEELIFRLVLLGLIFLLARELCELKSVTAGIVALVLSGAIFSAAHLVGPSANADLGVFIYRLSAGMVLGLIFLVRGFGIAAWTHALYDVYVLCFTPTY